MTNLKKLFSTILLITSFSNFTSRAMENSEDKQTNETDDSIIKREWSEDGNYLKITINGVIWTFGPFNDPNEENQPDPKTMTPKINI